MVHRPRVRMGTAEGRHVCCMRVFHGTAQGLQEHKSRASRARQEVTIARGMQQRGCMGFNDGVRGSRGEDEGRRCPGHSLVRMGGAGVGLARRDPAIV